MSSVILRCLFCQTGFRSSFDGVSGLPTDASVSIVSQVKCQGLLQKATSFASAQELRSALGSRTVKLFQSLSELEKEKTGR